MEDLDDSVKVVVNIRPLSTVELLNGFTDCVTVTPGKPQIQIGSHVFTYDNVYGSSGAPQSCRIFEDCVMPLVDALFRGYNATVLAYGQTGSGKTYTMGTNYSRESNADGIIPKVIEEIFEKVNNLRDSTEFLIRVRFIEIFKEEVFDLLTDTVKSGPSRVQIRETTLGGIILAGVSEPEVKSKEEMASFLARGSSNRATASMHMNSQSSRSHAIFTICIVQKGTASSSQTDARDDILISKLHLVDLAGSERAKRTGDNDSMLKEGIHINKGLLSLGNVINALGDEKRKEGAFVPYRDSKLTRVLQDSLGGNSKTLMIACISPADSNAGESVNTLKYANRARNIKNKIIVNRDPVGAEMQRLRSQVEQLQGELQFAHSSSSLLEEIKMLRERVHFLELKNEELLHQLNEQKKEKEQLILEKEKLILEKEKGQLILEKEKFVLEKEKFILEMEAARGGRPCNDIDDLHNEQEEELRKNKAGDDMENFKSQSMKPVAWSKEEIEALKEGVLEQISSQSHKENKKISWIQILEKYKHVFHPKRNNRDLKSKWVTSLKKGTS